MRVHLVHWHAGEAAERTARLEAMGHRAVAHSGKGGAAARELKAARPDVVVIDLGRLPSHGRRMAAWMREVPALRGVPVVFVGGEPAKAAGAREEFPDAEVTTWGRLGAALGRAASRPRKARPAPARSASPAPLPKKLGVRPESVLALLDAPPGFEQTLGALPDGVTVRKRAQGACDVLVLFAPSLAALRRRFPAAARALAPGGGLWVAWPKKASGVRTDLDRAAVMRLGLDAGLVDNKVCALDDTWSALRFVRRRSPRGH